MRFFLSLGYSLSDMKNPVIPTKEGSFLRNKRFFLTLRCILNDMGIRESSRNKHLVETQNLASLPSSTSIPSSSPSFPSSPHTFLFEQLGNSEQLMPDIRGLLFYT